MARIARKDHLGHLDHLLFRSHLEASIACDPCHRKAVTMIRSMALALSPHLGSSQAAVACLDLNLRSHLSCRQCTDRLRQCRTIRPLDRRSEISRGHSAVVAVDRTCRRDLPSTADLRLRHDHLLSWRIDLLILLTAAITPHLVVHLGRLLEMMCQHLLETKYQRR